jgi:hypothetical protein
MVCCVAAQEVQCVCVCVLRKWCRERYRDGGREGERERARDREEGKDVRATQRKHTRVQERRRGRIPWQRSRHTGPRCHGPQRLSRR